MRMRQSRTVLVGAIRRPYVFHDGDFHETARDNRSQGCDQALFLNKGMTILTHLRSKSTVNSKRLGSGRRRYQTFMEGLESRLLLSTTFMVTNADDAGAGSLRQAILDSNAASGAGVNTIDFALTGTGVHTLTPLSALPVITTSVVVDGTSQAGFAGSPLFEINFNDTGSQGIEISAGGSTIRGLTINGVGTGDLIILDTAGNNTIAGDFLGTNNTGTAADLPQLNNLSGAGIRIQGTSSNNTIGGITAADRNIISGNGGAGVFIAAGSTGNSVKGNYIGTDVTGTAAIPNLGDGIFLAGSSNNIGGIVSGAMNLISGNTGSGIQATTDSQNTIQGNFIGTDVTGLLAVGNGGNGMTLFGSTNDVIGGAAAGAGNVISGNTGNGIELEGTLGGSSGTPATGVTITGNLIGVGAGSSLATASVTGLIANGGHGIQSLDDHNTAILGNTIGYALAKNGWQVDSGPGDTIKQQGFVTSNGQTTGKPINRAAAQPVPTPTSAVFDAVSKSVTVQGTFHDTAKTSYTIDVYGQQVAIAGAFTGPMLFEIGQISVKTDAKGNATFAKEIAQSFFPSSFAGDEIAMTAGGDTSEFSGVTPLLNSLSINHLAFPQRDGFHRRSQDARPHGGRDGFQRPGDHQLPFQSHHHADRRLGQAGHL